MASHSMVIFIDTCILYSKQHQMKLLGLTEDDGHPIRLQF